MKKILLFMALLAVAGMVFYACGSSSSGVFIPGTKTTDTIYFGASDGYNGIELWKTRGTEATTVMVANINAETVAASDTPDSSLPMWFEEAGGTTYFTAEPGTGAIVYFINSAGLPQPLTEDDGETTLAFGDNMYTEANDKLYIINATGLGMVGADGMVHAVYEDNGTKQATLAGWMQDDGRTVYLVNGSGDLSRIGSDGLVYAVTEDDGKTPADASGGPLQASNDTVYLYNATGLGMVGSDGMTRPVYGEGGAAQVTAAMYIFESDDTYMVEFDGSISVVNSSGDVVPVVENDKTTQAVALSVMQVKDIDGTLYFVDDANGLAFVNAAGQAQVVMGPDGETALDETAIGGLYPAGSKLVFSYNTAESGVEPWIINSSGSAEMLMEINQCNDKAGNSFAGGIDDLSGVLYFVADDCQHGFELWRTQGTASTTSMVKDINVRTGDSDPGATGTGDVATGILYGANGGNMTGVELYSSGPAATALVKDIFAGSNSSLPALFVESGTNVFFEMNDGVNDILAMSDGTAAGTTIVNDTTATGDAVLYSDFTADNVAADDTLYYVDSTGALMFVNASGVAEEIDTSALGGVQDLRLVGGTVYLINTGGNGTLHALDTSAYPVLDTAITNVDGVGIVKPIDVTSAGTAVIFVAADTGLNGYTLYEIESGVAQEIREATTLNLLGANTDIIYNTSGTSKLYYGTATQIFEVDLTTDEATEIGTNIPVDADSFMEASDGAVYFLSGAATALYFIDDTVATEITTAGTVTEILEVGGVVYVVDNDLLRYIDANATLQTITTASAASGLMDAGGTLFLLDGAILATADTTGATNVDDGATAATDISGAIWYEFGDGKLFMSFDDGTNGSELWVVDPATDATLATMIEINANKNILSDNSDPKAVFADSNVFLFRAFSPDTGVELYVSDGTAAGTSMVTDINADTLSGIMVGP